MSLVATGILASFLAGLATGAGALPALFFKDVPDKLLSTLLGGAAGIMLAATSFSLIVPGIEHGNLLWPGYGVYVVAFGILFGTFCLDLVDRLMPHEHFILGHEGPSSRMKRIWLFIIAITIHNFPEGLAVGVGFGSGDMVAVSSLATGRYCPATFSITFGFVIMLTLKNIPGHVSFFFLAILWLFLILPPDCSKIKKYKYIRISLTFSSCW